MKKTFLSVVLIALILSISANGFLYYKLNGMNNNLQSLSSKVSALQGDISSISSSVSYAVTEALNKEQTNLTYYNIVQEKINPNNLTVDFSVEIIPKIIEDDTEVYFCYDEEKILLSQNSTKFSGNISVPVLSEKEFLPRVIIKSKGVEKNEILQDYRFIFDDLKEKMFLNVDVGYISYSYYNNSKSLVFSDPLRITFMKIPQGNKLTKAKLAFYLNEEEKYISQLNEYDIHEINSALEHIVDYSYFYDKNFEISFTQNIKENDELKVMLFIEDELGFKYEYPVDYIKVNEGNIKSAEYSRQQIIIKDSKGNIVK